MPGRSTKSENHIAGKEILTLAEAAAYLRASESALEQLVATDAIPARKIGGEWRFLRKALDDWLQFPGVYPRDYWKEYPRWMLDSPFVEEFVHLLAKHLKESPRRAAHQEPQPGSKKSILAQFGIFGNDDDLDERLADLRKQREGSG
jgi:excisionase family DNA binding protein